MKTQRSVSPEEVLQAEKDWGANCGPVALAEICGVSLNEVRDHLDGFDKKKYTNPQMMYKALDSIGVDWKKAKSPLTWPTYGLIRVQCKVRG